MAYYPLATEFGAHYRLTSGDGLSIATFNDPTDPNYVGALTEVTGLDSAEVREAAADLTEADGGSHGNFFLGRRPINMVCRVFGHASILERNLRVDRVRRASLALRADSILSWKPSVRRENLVWNPRAAVDLSNGIGGTLSGQSNGTLARITSGVPGGYATGYEITGATIPSTTWGSTYGSRGGTGTSAIPVDKTRQYVAAVSGRIQAVTSGSITGIRCYVYWYQADGSPSAIDNATLAGSIASGTTGTDYLLGGVLTPPADAAYAAVRVYITGATGTAFAVRYSGFQFEAASSVLPYIDGDMAGMYWQGDPYKSPSGNFIEQFTRVRRQGPFRESGAWVKDLQIPLVSEFAYIFSNALKTSAAGVAMENRGNIPTYPLVAITGPVTNPTVSDGTRVFRTTNGLLLASGETVTFDFLNHTGTFTNNVGGRQGQSANRYIDWALTDWPRLDGLGTTQTFTVSGGTASISYRDAWA